MRGRAEEAGRRGAACSALALVGMLICLAAPTGAAAAPQFFWEDCAKGGGAGRCDLPRGIATDPVTGHLYEASEANARIDELTAWGDFVRAFGWGVRDGSAEMQTCTTESGCLQGIGAFGIGGSGAGEMAKPRGVAVDSAGNVYVADVENHRIQKFTPEGAFLRTWGGGVISGGGAGTGDLSSGSTQITNVTTTTKSFEIGQSIEGAGIPAGTDIRDLGVGTIALSKAAAASGSGVAITAPVGAGNVVTNERQSVSLEGGPSGGGFTLTFSPGRVRGQITSGSKVISATHIVNEQTIGSFHVGDAISGSGIPAAATIAAIDTATGSLTLSANATATSNSRVSAEETTTAIPFNASAAEVQAALEALPAIGAGNAIVSGAAGGPWSIEFKGLLLGDVNVAALKGNGAGLIPSGTVKVQTTQEGASAPEICAIAKDCRAGVEAAGGEGRFGAWAFGNNIAVGAGDQLHVGEGGRIQVFGPEGNYLESLAVTGTVKALAAEPSSGHLYAAFSAKADVLELSAAGATLCTATVASPEGIAANADGSGGFYVVDGSAPVVVRHFADVGCGEDEAPFGEGEINRTIGIATGAACYSEGEGIYLTDPGLTTTSIRAYGPSPDPAPDKLNGEGELVCPPGEVAPTISAQYAISVDIEEAVLGAKINPHFWPETTYYLEYGTGKCSEGGCPGKKPVPPGSLLGAGVVNEDHATAGTLLSNLEPNTTYHYRFVSESGGGGPAFGEDPDGEAPLGEASFEAGLERTFTTYPGPTSPSCPANEPFRGGPSARLPDCRAFELVSPPDKEGGDAQARFGGDFLAHMDQSAREGSAVTYSSYRAYNNPEGAPYTSQYLARRSSEGWATENISPPQEGEAFLDPLLQLDNNYRAFAADLSEGWVFTDTEPVLGEGGLAGSPNLYRRGSETGAYEACTTAPPLLPEVSAEGTATHGPQLQGFAADGSLAVFRLENKLTEGASSKLKGVNGVPIYQLYACSFDGEGAAQIQLVSALPDGTASELENNAGGPSNHDYAFDHGRTETLEGAVAGDGSRVFWTASNGLDGANPGALYVRVNPAAEPTPTGECSEAEPQAACTIEISAGPARFWLGAGDGSKAIFEEGGKLLEFETDKALGEEGAVSEIAGGALGVVGASKDASRVYFGSSEAIAGSGQNGLGEEAVAGKANLYLYEVGEGEGEPTYSFVAPVAPTSPEPNHRTSRVTPDGGALVFTSNSAALAAATAGYDNADLASEEPDSEVYRYEAASGELACLSCNRGGARPRGRKVGSSWIAAVLPPWENSLYAPRVISEDGSRVYFESFEALVLADTNGKSDVYQWEAAGSGDCTGANSTYVPASGGCVGLLSSGQAPEDAEFMDASGDGTDVFFRTSASLLPQDPANTIDVYDARAGGGFPPPTPPDPECEGQACQDPPPGPEDPTPASLGYEGPGNLSEGGKPARHCAKGHHKVKKAGKTRCVKDKKKPKRKKRGGAGRRGGSR